MKTALIVLAALTVAVAANAQTNGTLSAPDYFGNRHIQYSNGVSGTINNPDYFGNQHFQYSNGVSGTISNPDYFGNRHIQYQQQLMPRRNGW